MDSCIGCGRNGAAAICSECLQRPIGEAYRILRPLHPKLLVCEKSPGARVAIKLARVDRAERKRIVRELRRVAELKHPHIVPIRDCGVLHGGVYVAMDLLDGPSLADSKLAVRRELEILAQAAEAVAAAHKKNIVHGNLKPSNILISDGSAKVAGFCLRSDPPPPHYAAPDPAPAPAGDVYALGATLYFVLTGVPPFAEARSFAEYASLAAVTRPLPPSQLNREISKDYESLVFIAMEPILEKRLQKASEFTHLLREAMRKGTVPAGVLRKRASASPTPSPPSDIARHLDKHLEPIETLLSQAEAKLGNSEASKLEQTLKGCLALHPSHARTLFLLGRLYMLLERRGESLECLDRAMSLSPELTPAAYFRSLLLLQQLLLSSRAFDGAIPRADDALARELRRVTDRLGAEGDPRQFFTHGLVEFFGTNPEIGFDLLRRASGLLPQLTEAQLYFGIACFFKKQLDKAAEAWAKLTTLRRSGLALRFAVQCRRALAEAKKGAGEDPAEEYREAMRSSDELIKLEPESVDAWAQRAELLLSKADGLTRAGWPCTREIREAMEITRTMSEKHPAEAARFYALRGEIRRTLAERRQSRGEPHEHLIEQAIGEYRRALSVDAKHLPALAGLVSALRMKGSEQEALDLSRRLTELQPVLVGKEAGASE